MADKRPGPEGATPGSAGGALGGDHHGVGGANATPTEEPGAGPESGRLHAVDDDADVEGHNFGHNAMLSRNAAQSREREVQRNLREHDLKTEAKRPFFKKG